MDIYLKIAECIAQGKSFILATLINTSGSVPRDVGAKMLVYPDGSIFGTIGGGAFEKMIIDDCLVMFKGETTNQLKAYLLQDSGPDSLGMYCGGKADVFLERFSRPNTIYIFGGGHIGRDLAAIANGLNFRVVIVDDRPEILAQYRYPVETIQTDSEFNQNFPVVDKSSFVVIVTHGHKCDRQVLEKVINIDCPYIGMIGSKTKIIKTFADLEKVGIDRAKLEKVHSPIGLNIGAEGPYEIAVSIAAQIIAVIRKPAPKM